MELKNNNNFLKIITITEIFLKEQSPYKSLFKNKCYNIKLTAGTPVTVAVMKM